MVHSGGERLGRTVLSAEEIERVVWRLAGEIDEEYRGTVPVAVIVLRGAFVFAADLLRRMRTEVCVDFIEVASYTIGARSTGRVELRRDLREDVAGQRVLVIEDIIDTGRTARFILDHIGLHQPADIKVVTLLDKRGRRMVEVPVDFVGVRIPNVFVVGYGLDMNGRFRNLPYVAECHWESSGGRAESE